MYKLSYLAIKKEVDVGKYFKYLTDLELKNLNSIPKKKLKEYIYGRILVKKTVYQYLKHKNYNSCAIDISNIEVLSGNRSPKISLLNQRDGLKYDLNLHLSISHTKNLVCCCLLEHDDYTTGLGVDIEYIRDFQISFVEKFMTKKEFLHYLNLPSHHDKKCYSTLIWCLKEAYYKAKSDKATAFFPSQIEILSSDNGSMEVYERDVCITNDITWTFYRKKYILAVVKVNKAV